jgi:hypothetical protein
LTSQDVPEPEPVVVEIFAINSPVFGLYESIVPSMKLLPSIAITTD